MKTMAIISAAMFASGVTALAQHNHELYHVQYQGWSNNNGFNCCNDKDCGTLPDKDVREQGGMLEVAVPDNRGDAWCPVLWLHLISQQFGPKPSPDANLYHACILPEGGGAATPCDRFKCFMDKQRS